MDSRLWSHDLLCVKTKMLFYTCHALIINIWGKVGRESGQCSQCSQGIQYSQGIQCRYTVNLVTNVSGNRISVNEENRAIEMECGGEEGGKISVGMIAISAVSDEYSRRALATQTMPLVGLKDTG